MPFRPSRQARASARRIDEWRSRPESDFVSLKISLGAICKLEKQMRGNLVLPTSAQYNEDRQLANPAFQHYPQLIAYCEVDRDVQLCLEFAKAQDVWVSCRAGGHSFGGYSVNDGMVIDVSRMNNVTPLPGGQLVQVGAGANFGHLNAVLNGYGLHIPGGACADVCVAGYMQGGGYGYTSRCFGMNCDNVESFRMMLRDGTIVTASATEYDDLYWAVRGGTGGNFGILLDVTYRAHPLGDVWAFAWVWDIEQAPALLVELQKNYMTEGAPPNLGYMASMARVNGQDIFAVQGIYVGDGVAGGNSLASLRSVAEPNIAVDSSGTYEQMNEWANNNPFQIPTFPVGAVIKEAKQAGYISRTLDLLDWQTIVNFFKTTPNEMNTLVIEPYGGAINAYPKFGNAFIHRDVSMDLFVDSFWIDPANEAEAKTWLDNFMELMKPYYNGHVYQNYPRVTLKDYRWMYFGEAFDALLSIKNKYDPPPYFFHYQQCIQPYQPGEAKELPRNPELLKQLNIGDTTRERGT